MAQESAELVFVEVRTHSSSQSGTPEESVSQAKVHRLLAAAQDYMKSPGDDLVCWGIALVSVRAAAIGNLQNIDQLRHTVQL